MILFDHDGRADEPPRGIMIRLLVVASYLTARDDIFTSMAAWQVVAKIVMTRVTSSGSLLPYCRRMPLFSCHCGERNHNANSPPSELKKVSYVGME